MKAEMINECRFLQLPLNIASISLYSPAPSPAIGQGSSVRGLRYYVDASNLARRILMPARRGRRFLPADAHYARGAHTFRPISLPFLPI